MPRGGGRSSGGFGRSSGSRSSSYGSRSSSTHTAPPRTNVAPTHSSSPMTSGGSMMGGLGSTLMTGMAFGGGSAIGHSVVRNLMGGSSGHEQNNVQPQYQNQAEYNQNNAGNTQTESKINPCTDYNFKFVECLKSSDNDIAKCQSLFDELKNCEKGLM